MPIDGFPVTVQTYRQESAVVKWVVHDLVSRLDVTLNNSGGGSDMVLEAGTVLGQQTVGTPGQSYSGTGNGTLTGLAVGAGAKVGAYTAKCITGGASAVFELIDPLGRQLAQVPIGVAGAGGPDLSFEINGGSTNFAVGDAFTIAVPAGAGTWVPLNLSAVDGSQNAAGLLYARAFVAAGMNDDGGAVVRQAVVNANTLIWPSGATATQIAAATAQLAALGIIAIANQV